MKQTKLDDVQEAQSMNGLIDNQTVSLTCFYQLQRFYEDFPNQFWEAKEVLGPTRITAGHGD